MVRRSPADKDGVVFFDDDGTALVDTVPQARFDVTAFHNDITDLIEFDFVAGRPENIGNATTSGVEVSGDWSPGATVTLSGNYAFTRATPEGSADQLVRRPRHQGGIRATFYPAQPLRVWTEVRFKGERFDNGASGREALDRFGLVNVAADYEVQRMLILRGRVDNLFDADYEEVLGYGTAGLSGYFGVTVKLSRR